MEKYSEKYVAVLGASNNPDRYSNMAVRLLIKKGYTVIPVHPRLKEVEGLTVINELSSIQQSIHTLSLYAGPVVLKNLVDDIIKLKPGRVIFNPGTQYTELEKKLDHSKIPWISACTLVMLNNGIF